MYTDDVGERGSWHRDRDQLRQAHIDTNEDFKRAGLFFAAHKQWHCGIKSVIRVDENQGMKKTIK